MKRFRTLVVLSASTMLIGTVAVAFAAGTGPESDIASATFTATVLSKVDVACATPEDTLVSPYIMAKTTGKWSGTVVDTSPSPQPWNATGPTPDRSVAGHATITGSVTGDAIPGAGGGIVSGWGKLIVVVTQGPLAKYSGPAQIVTQANGSGNIEGRGQLIAKFYSRAVKTDPFVATGDYLVANIEFTINGTTFAVSGQFGGAAGTHAGLDYSVETTELC